GGGRERPGELEGVRLGDAAQHDGAAGGAQHGLGGEAQRRADEREARSAVSGVDVGAGHGPAGGGGGGAAAVEADDLTGLDHRRGAVGDPLALGGGLVGPARHGGQRVGDVDGDDPAGGAPGELGAL